MIDLKRQDLEARILAKRYVTTVLVLLLIGLVFIYSASSVHALESKSSAAYFVKKQFFAILLGLFAGILMLILPCRLVKKLIPVFFGGALFLCILTLVPKIGVKTYGSRRWLNLFITFQPSEFLKYAFIGYVAKILSERNKKLVPIKYLYFKIVFLTAIVSAVLLLQPDFGMTVTLVVTALAMLLVIPGSLRYVLLTTICALPAAIFLVITKAYRLKRILTFLDPWKDPEGAGFQIIQSLIAIGSGGLFGHGIGYSRQKFFYLPMQHTDFIMAIIVEETGFMGACLLILIYLTLLWTGFKWAVKTTDSLGYYLIIGYTWLILIQVMINMAVVSGLFPTKGLGLPFISYGSTAIVALLWYLGVIIKVAKN
jgi:cell division protein FtsW